MDVDLFNEWFRIADTDHDNLVSGAEAVTFFQRSGLTQDTLFQVWNLVAGDSPSLTKPQFYSTLRLISLAQRDGGVLNEAAARSVMIGVGPAVPPPVMAGLEARRPSTTQQTWQAAPQVPDPAARYPPMAAADAEHYRSVFAAMDADRDGYLQGSECFAFFLQSGLGKGALKDVWAAVAGDEGRLSASQFLACLYLIDLARRGLPVPAHAPPAGPDFPPIAGGSRPGIGSGLSLPGMQQGGHDVFAHELPLPPLPPRAAYAPSDPPSHAARTPSLENATLAGLAPQQAARVRSEHSSAAGLDEQLWQAQAGAQAAQQREAMYRAALQELTLFKSRTSAALLQARAAPAQERRDREAADADAMQAQYQAAWVGAEATHAQGRQLLDNLTRARARKAEATTKLAELQCDIAQLEQLSPDQVAAEDSATRQLLEEVAAAEARRSQLELQAEAAGEERRLLARALEELQLSCAAGQADVAAAQRDLDSVRDKLKAEDEGAAAELKRLLRSTAAVYRTLLSHAEAARVEVPPEARLGGGSSAESALVWNEFAAADAANWDNFDDEGFEVVSALPAISRSSSPGPLDAGARMVPPGGHGNGIGDSGGGEPSGSAASASAAFAVDKDDMATSAPHAALAFGGGANRAQSTDGWAAF
ncbi:hypothetical protein WJX81_004424 [Elliptochloris bilobata]|uniref:Epidermal growth factor receptor substrate 15 n=1 Tax=Elliptochloris bilobata TaxID=381761 RepID=A0AAW1SE51_9CHLO